MYARTATVVATPEIEFAAAAAAMQTMFTVYDAEMDEMLANVLGMVVAELWAVAQANNTASLDPAGAKTTVPVPVMEPEKKPSFVPAPYPRVSCLITAATSHHLS
jgi:hypothetical protein